MSNPEGFNSALGTSPPPPPRKHGLGQLGRCSATYKELVRDVTVTDNLCCGNLQMEEFKIVRKDREASSRTKTPDFRRTDFKLLKELLEGFHKNIA